MWWLLLWLLLLAVSVQAKIRWMSSDVMNNATTTLVVVDISPFVLYAHEADGSHHIIVMSYYEDYMAVPSAIAMMYFHQVDVTGFVFGSTDYQKWMLPYPDTGKQPYQVAGGLITDPLKQEIVNINIVFDPKNDDYYISVPGTPIRFHYFDQDFQQHFVTSGGNKVTSA